MRRGESGKKSSEMFNSEEELPSFVIIASGTPVCFHQSHKNIIVMIIKAPSSGMGGKRLHINIQHQPIHSFIVFRYIFIVQQFAPMASAVHFDEVFVQGFVICMNTHYVISLIISRSFVRWLRRRPGRE